MQEPPENSPNQFDQPQPPDDSGGADRFWSEFSRTTNGRTRGEGPDAGDAHGKDGPAHLHTGEHECLEWCPICRGAEALRGTGRPELKGQMQGLQRDALISLRALIDAYIERLGEVERAQRGAPVEDIPIE